MLSGSLRSFAQTPSVSTGSMVVQKRSQAGSARHAPKLTTCKPKVACQWKHCPPVTCTSCKQDTHSVDRDSPPEDPVFVEWVQKRPGPKGKPVPKGFTCYRCYDTRRCVFKEFDSMKECQDARDKDEALDQKFLGSRRSRMNMTPAEKRADRTGAGGVLDGVERPCKGAGWTP